MGLGESGASGSTSAVGDGVRFVSSEGSSPLELSPRLLGWAPADGGRACALFGYGRLDDMPSGADGTLLVRAALSPAPAAAAGASCVDFIRG